MHWHRIGRESLGRAVFEVDGIQQILQRNIHGIRIAEIMIAVGVSEALCIDECHDLVFLRRSSNNEVIIEAGDHDLCAAR